MLSSRSCVWSIVGDRHWFKFKDLLPMRIYRVSRTTTFKADCRGFILLLVGSELMSLSFCLLLSSPPYQLLGARITTSTCTCTRPGHSQTISSLHHSYNLAILTESPSVVCCLFCDSCHYPLPSPETHFSRNPYKCPWAT